MKTNLARILFTAMIFVGSAQELLFAGETGPVNLPATSPAAQSGQAATSADVETSPLSAEPSAAQDSCLTQEVTANPTRPNWDTSASSTQCGILESDYGFQVQPMGGGVHQSMLVTSLRYGITSKLDLRWGLTNHISQSGGGMPSLEGVGDYWLGVRYRFQEQGRFTPAMAFLYNIKIPMANPAKGFGSGFVDHQPVFIASRDLGHYHLDFNAVGTVVGEKQGHDGAAQFGLAVTHPVNEKLSVILESYGGPQPETSNRFGAGFAGATYTLRPTLVIDGAYSKTYTAGSPRQQVLFGVTYARRAGFGPMARNLALSRLLGR